LALEIGIEVIAELNAVTGEKALVTEPPADASRQRLMAQTPSSADPARVDEWVSLATEGL
jgi:hypothetical protein